MNDAIVLDHGTGGLRSRDLIESLIVPAFAERYLGRMEDSAAMEQPVGDIAITTDSFVIDPLFYGNGDIGKLAICGTVNDLAVSGATPLYLTFALIIEVGLSLSDLRKIVESAADAAREADVYIVAGDTKVVGKGAADKLFINTAGVGVFERGMARLSSSRIQNGDAIIVTSPIGNHSIHLLSIREGLGFEKQVVSDCAPMNHLIREVISSSGDLIHCIRDLTRGGLGTALNEIAADISSNIRVDSACIPVQHETKMAAEMLGVDPVYLANEGSCVLFCAPGAVEATLESLHNHQYGRHAARIGYVENSGVGDVFTVTNGRTALMEPLLGVQLPRLC